MKIIPSEKFTDVSLIIRTRLPLDQKTITAYNVLLFMMRSRSEALESKQKFSMALNNAYGLKAGFGLNGYGSEFAIDQRFQYIRSDYIDEPGYIEQVLFLLEQMIEHPLLNEDTFQEAKYLLEERLRRQQDDPDSIAIQNALKQSDPEHSISIAMQGDLKELEKLTLQDVLDVYEIYKNAPKEAGISGAADPEVLTYLESLYQAKPVSYERLLLRPHAPVSREISRHISQTSLAQIYATQIDPADPDYYALLVLNSMLGMGPSALLMEEIREKHSYCYSIYSSLLRFDGAMLILCGTSRDHLADVKRLIAQIIDQVAGGEFSLEDLEAARMDLKDAVIVQQDRPFGQLEQYLMDQLLNREKTTAAMRLDAIAAVTKEDVMAAAKKLVLVSECSVVEEEYEDPAE